MTTKLTPNADATRAFIKLLAPDGIVTFQTFDDDKVRKNPGLARVYHGTLDQYLDDLTKLQHQGAGVFVIATSVTMPPPASRAFVAGGRIVTFA